MMRNKTTKYILPILGRHLTEHPELVETYLGKDDTEIGKFLYVLIKSEDKMFWIGANDRFLSVQNLGGGYYLNKFSLTEEENEKIIQPFLEGKYSEIDRDYVTKNFFSIKFDETARCFIISEEYKVLTKDVTLKQKLEEELDVKIETDAELASIPYIEDELFSVQRLNQIISLIKD